MDEGDGEKLVGRNSIENWLSSTCGDKLMGYQFKAGHIQLEKASAHPRRRW
jgi:hypothetical protein